MIVVDASVLVKSLKPDEQGHEEAIGIIEKHLDGKDKVIVPDLAFVEVANYLATKTQTRAGDIKEGLQKMFEFEFEIVNVGQKDLIEAAVLAKKHATAVFDMIYAVVARKKKVTLVTSDIKFKDKVKWKFVKGLGE